VIADSTTILTDLQKIPGFEGTDYAYLHGDIVWAGEQASNEHPRNAFSMWQPKTISFRTDKLIEGALICNTLFSSNHPLASQAKGLLLWLQSIDMPFPMNLSAARFDAIKHALIASDLHAFTAASLRVLGLGNGLTPSGDDFIGGIFFALAHAPRQAWIADLTAAKNHIQLAAKSTTNVISAALLDDMMMGCSYSALHDVLAALNSQDIEKINTSCNKLLTLGASSGADMLAGLLLALTTQNQSLNH
jgi:hypothetical protein